MNPNRGNQLLPVIIIVIIVVVSVAAIVALARTLLFNTESSDGTEQVQRNTLTEVTSDRAVRMTIRGEITANEEFRSYQITISPSSRVMTTYAGYLDNQIETVNLDNNTRAYEEFVYALDREGMMEGTPLEGEENDRRGLCPGGKILEFETLRGGQSEKMLWTSTCGGRAGGSFEANSSQISDMFLQQIPQGPKLLQNIDEN